MPPHNGDSIPCAVPTRISNAFPYCSIPEITGFNRFERFLDLLTSLCFTSASFTSARIPSRLAVSISCCSLGLRSDKHCRFASSQASKTSLDCEVSTSSPTYIDGARNTHLDWAFVLDMFWQFPKRYSDILNILL